MKKAGITWSTTKNVLQRVLKTMVHQRCHDEIAEEHKAVSINERQQSSWPSITVTYRKDFRMNAQSEKKKMRRVKQMKAKNTLLAFSSSGRTRLESSVIHIHTDIFGIYTHTDTCIGGGHRAQYIHTVSWQPVLNWMELV